MNQVLAGVLLVLACAAPVDGPAPGIHGADTPDHPGFVQLRVEKDGAVTLLNVVTLHLPPAELERHTGRLVRKDGRTCIAPAPSSIEPCLTKDKQGRWQVTLKSPAGQVLTLIPEPSTRP